MKAKQKILVQIDGSNFYNRVKTLQSKIHLTYFDYYGLAKEITQVRNPLITYYVGAIRRLPSSKKSKRLYASQQTLFSHLRKQQIAIKLGYLLFSGGVYHEKGVDVQIAVDLVRGALKDEFDKCYLISSDTDLLPAIKLVQDEGKEVIYVGFENFISKALTNNCSSTLTLIKKQIQQFV